MVTQSRGPTNPYYYGRAEQIDPTYLALIQILQQMMAATGGPTGQVGPGGGYNPFAWMDEGGLTPQQKRLADEQRQAADAMQAMQWNLNQPGMRDYLGTPVERQQGSLRRGETTTEFNYQPTPQDVQDWRRPSAPMELEEALQAGGSASYSRGGQASPTGMLTPEMLTAFLKSFQGGGADAGVLESIDKELEFVRSNPGVTPEEKQANAARASELQTLKDKILSGSGVSGGGVMDQLQQLLGLFAGPQKHSEINVDVPEGTTGVSSNTRFGVGALPATGAGATVKASYLTGPEAVLTTMGLYTPPDDLQKLLDKAKTQSSPLGAGTAVEGAVQQVLGREVPPKEEASFWTAIGEFLQKRNPNDQEFIAKVKEIFSAWKQAQQKQAEAYKSILRTL